MGDLQAGKCAETREGIMVGSLLRCDLLAGHPGRHHDPNDVDWSAGVRDAGTVEYAEYRVECASGEPHEPSVRPYFGPRWAIHDATEADRIQRRDPEMPQCGPHHIAQSTVTRTPWTPVDPKDGSE